MASSAARTRCARVVPRVRPLISAARVGAPVRRAEPGERGTKSTPPLTSTDAASASPSSASPMMPRPSRSHWIAAPATKTAPSSAYCGGSCSSARRPRCAARRAARRRVARVSTRTKQPVPYVAFACPARSSLAEERRLLVAGDAGDRHRRAEQLALAECAPDGADLAAGARGRRRTARAARRPSRASRGRSSSVRDAFVASVRGRGRR